MTISSPVLVSCSARIDDTIICSAGSGEAYIFAFKEHQGSPLLEAEVFRVADIQAAQSGPYFFNVNPTQIPILDQSFQLVTGIIITSQAALNAGADPVIRFYWNAVGRGSGPNPILYIDYNINTNQATTPVQQVSFPGLDPFVLDARTSQDPNRLYMLYITPTGAVSFHISHDLGATWGVNTKGCATCCQFGGDAYYVEGFLEDPQGLKQMTQAVLREQPPSTDDVYLVDISMASVATGGRTKQLYPFYRRRARLDDSGRDLQRLNVVYPLIRRQQGVIFEDPC